MVRKHTIYQGLLLLWILGSFGAAIAVMSGNAEPYVSMSDVPTGTPLPLFGGAIGGAILGGVVLGRLSRRDWKRAGREAGLTASQGGLIGKPDLEGTVQGRTVRMRTVKRKTKGGSQSGSTSTTYTVLEVDLTEPVDDGIVIQAGDAPPIPGDVDQVNLSATNVDGIGVYGAGENFSREVLTSRVRQKLDASTDVETIIVGNATDAMMAAVPDSSGFIVGKITDKIEEYVEDSFFGDARTVRIQRKGVVLDGAELDRQVDALVAVAESFEAATAGPR